MMPGARKLGRPTAHRLSMLRGLVTAVLEKGKITTTATRAQETAILAEKMITLGKKGTVAARRQAMRFITKEDVVKKLFGEIAPAFAERSGGYTRMTLLGPRRGDAAEMAMLEVLDEKTEIFSK
ncbi:MAG: 50S ribosomal protein L17 [Oscillospiraceae bacterium]|nr:50S ribosomal protein L17 [Oscillospiraceae bacterium]